MSFKYKVVVLQHRLLHYRLGLFEKIRLSCAESNIDFHLVHGQASRREAARKDEGKLSWAHEVTNKFLEIGERDILWQPYPSELKDADLVVVMQESRILSNYPLLLSRLWNKRKVAYWGHGVNFQSDSPNGLRERWKQIILTKVDWWFAYTQITVELLKNSGYPLTKITCLNNAIDTSGFKADLNEVSNKQLTEAKKKLGLDGNSQIALFCGSLYADKKLELLIDAADLIIKKIPSFKFLIIGDGPSMAFLKAKANSRPWIHLLGVSKGAQKAIYFKLAHVMLNPGLVGLHIVDAFCAGLVIFTTKTARHSPEVAYLDDGINGVATDDNAEAYSEAVLEVLLNPERLKSMKLAALNDSEVYSLEHMVDNFVDGIKKVLHQN